MVGGLESIAKRVAWGVVYRVGDKYHGPGRPDGRCPAVGEPKRGGQAETLHSEWEVHMQGCVRRMALAGGLTAAVVGCADRRYEPFALIRSHLAVAQGKQHLEAEEIDEALFELQNAVELNPRLKEAHAGLGAIWERKGDFEAAARRFAEAVRLDPSNFDYNFSLARMYQRLLRFPDAVRAYLQACELQPVNLQARLNLASCYHQAGELNEAIAHYQRAIELAPDEAAAYANLGAAYDTQQKYYEAIHAYNESLERDPQQPLVLINLATTLIKQNRLANAHKSLERAIEIAPELALAHERMGYCCFLERSLDEARRHYEKAVALDPKMPEAHAGLGITKMSQYLQSPTEVSLRQEAVDCWHKSLELNPDQPKIRNLVSKYAPAGSADSNTVLLETP